MSTRSAKGMQAKPRSSKSTEKSAATESVEVRLKGPGVTTLGLVDGMGNVLMSRRVLVSGPEELEMKFQMPLSLSTKRGELAAVAVLFHQTSTKQLVMVGGKDATTAAAERARALNLSATAIAKVKAATEAAATQISKMGRLTAPAHR